MMRKLLETQRGILRALAHVQEHVPMALLNQIDQSIGESMKHYEDNHPR